MLFISGVQFQGSVSGFSFRVQFMVQIMSSVPGFSFRIKFQGLVPGFRVQEFSTRV